jgi:5-methyltetrahydropteroyltriglutamate--homocysteine methyltransferase
MTRSGSRILTTHVGSLIRPADLLQRSKAAKQSPQELARYEHTLRCATVNVVEQQINAGIDIVNDGEFGKPRWSKYVLDRLTGFELRADLTFEPVWLGRDRIRFRQFMEDEFPRGATSVPGHVCVAPIALCSSRSWLVART